MDNFYKGDEIKFAINLEAPGFSMDEDDFIIEVKSGKTSVVGYKTPVEGAATDVVVFKETEIIPPAEEGGEETIEDVWYAIVDTKSLAIGTMVVVATAKIVDANANDGVRDSIAVAQLGKLIEA